MQCGARYHLRTDFELRIDFEGQIGSAFALLADRVPTRASPPVWQPRSVVGGVWLRTVATLHRVRLDRVALTGGDLESTGCQEAMVACRG